MKRKLILFTGLTLMLIALMVAPVFSAPKVIANMFDTYLIKCSIPVKYMDGTYLTRVTSALLTITDNTTATRGVITNASIEVTGLGTVAMVGFVGAGKTPKISLVGSDGATVVNFNGTVRTNDAGLLPVSISGRMDGWRWHAGGTLGDDPFGAVASWSAVDSYNGSIAVLLTQAAADGSTHVAVTPPAGIHLHDIDTIISGWSFWHRLENNKTYGPQVELRFTHPFNINPDGAGHVDVTLLPHQEAGDNTWEQEQLTGAGTLVGYYGMDPFDATDFDEFSGTLHMNDVEAAINAEGAMLANGGFTCGDWVLTRVRVELWEAGARTCYIDDLTINGTVYTFEPLQFGGTFRALP